ncbi:MAG: hypothetical protein HY907_12845 [Deltaproteobacteria bacterium]|nr:hypothetical protein [Deltaproteobacteria bacterium]
MIEFTPRINVGPSEPGAADDLARNYECRAEKVRTFRSTDADLDDLAEVFRDRVNFVFDFRRDAVGTRRCRVDAPVWYQECSLEPPGCDDIEIMCEWVCEDKLDTETALDGPSVPILGNTAICLNIAQSPTVPGGPAPNDFTDWFHPTSPYLESRFLYYWTNHPLEASSGTVDDPPAGGLPYGLPEFPCPAGSSSPTGCVPSGFVGMDACWALRVVDSLDYALSNSIVTPLIASISDGANQGDPQGLAGLPAMVCNAQWMAQWMQAADRSSSHVGPPDGWVTDAHDAPYWFYSPSDPSPTGWWWDRDGDTLFNACRDYLDGNDDFGSRGESCDSVDFGDWNALRDEYHPHGYEYISREDIRTWGWSGCPIAKYGFEPFEEFTEWTPFYDILHLSPGDKVYFAPDNRPAFCNRAGSPSAVSMLPEEWEGVSGMTARWVDVGGRPALRLRVELGADIGITAGVLWSRFGIKVGALNLDITIQPRLCEGLRPSDFCVHKNPDGGACDRVLRHPPPRTELCGSEIVVPDALPDAGIARRGDEEQDSNPPIGEHNDELPEPLVLPNNNVLYHLDVSASFDRTYAALYCPEPFSCAISYAIIWAVGESKLEDLERKQAATMFNALGRAVYYGMPYRDVAGDGRGVVECREMDDDGNCVWYDVEPGFAAAARYLRRWFWQPAIDQLPHGGDGLDVTRAPDPNAVKFTDIRWASSAHDTAEFAFTWDKDFDGFGEEEDNCPDVANDQFDTDSDCVGNACEGDMDGDRCCEGGCEADAAGMEDCICGGPDPDLNCDTDAAGRTCVDDDVWTESWNHDDDDGVPDDCDPNDDLDVFVDDVDWCDFTTTAYNWDHDGDRIGNACDDSDDHDRCRDDAECPPVDYVPDDPMQPCGEAACVNGQCRVGSDDFPYDRDPPLCGCESWDERHTHCLYSTCESLGQTCVYHPVTGVEITDPDAFFQCESFATVEPFSCSLLSGGPSGAPLSEGGVEDVYEAFHAWPYGPSHMPPYVTTLIPCLPEAGDDCCRTCTEPIIRVVGQDSTTLAEIRPMAALDRPIDDFMGMDVTVVPDLNANNSNDIVVSLPYAVDENKGVVGTIVTFDGQSGEVLRVRERDGGFGNLMARAGQGMAARFRPLMSIFSGELAVGSIDVEPEQSPGISLMNRWGIEVAFVADNPNVKGASPTRMSGAWLLGEELAVVYTPTCDFVSNKGCLTGYDQYGAVKWSAAGWQSGNEFGASFDSDGTYLVVGIPGYDTGTGGMVQVLRPGSNWSRNITQRGRVQDLGRHVAIAEATSGPRILASALVNDAPVVLEFALNGRLRATYPAPAGWKIVDVVSPAFDDGTTLDLFAIVYITPEGRVFHELLHADGSNSGR